MGGVAVCHCHCNCGLATVSSHKDRVQARPQYSLPDKAPTGAEPLLAFPLRAPANDAIPSAVMLMHVQAPDLYLAASHLEWGQGCLSRTDLPVISRCSARALPNACPPCSPPCSPAQQRWPRHDAPHLLRLLTHSPAGGPPSPCRSPRTTRALTSLTTRASQSLSAMTPAVLHPKAALQGERGAAPAHELQPLASLPRPSWHISSHQGYAAVPAPSPHSESPV